MIKVLIVDDEQLMRDGLKAMLELRGGYKVVSIADCGEKAIISATENKPDLVLLDIRMPGMNGVETVTELKQKNESMKVIMLTTFNDTDYIMDALANGADGYLLKDMDSQELIESIQSALDGNLVMPSKVASNLKKGLFDIKKQKEGKKELQKVGFSQQEIKISSLMIKGFTNSQIAKALYLSQGTIRNYVSSIYQKINVDDRTNAVIYLKEYLS